MTNSFKNWIKATKNDSENLEQTKTFLKLILLSTDDKSVEHYSEVQLILDYLDSDDDEVSRRVEMSVVNLLKLITGNNDNNDLELSKIRESFENK